MCLTSYVRRMSVHHISPAEQKILDLSRKVIAAQGTAELEPAVRQLRKALHEYLNSSRDRVADLAFVIAAHDDSKAAD